MTSWWVNEKQRVHYLIQKLPEYGFSPAINGILANTDKKINLLETTSRSRGVFRILSNTVHRFSRYAKFSEKLTFVTPDKNTNVYDKQ